MHVYLPGEMVNYLLGSRVTASLPSLCSVHPMCSVLSPELTITPLPLPVHWQPNNGSQNCLNEKKVEAWLIRGTPTPCLQLLLLTQNSVIQLGQGWDCWVLHKRNWGWKLLFFPGCWPMGDCGNCPNPTVASEEKECEGGTSQGKWENAGTKCEN